jgi:DNA topoisomerase-2
MSSTKATTKTTTKNASKYQEKDEISHILDRPDMYVGSTKPKKMTEYIAEEENSKIRILEKEITVSHAFVRIFIEILSNAIDNVARSKKNKTPCTKIKVGIDKETGETYVWNDGEYIPIEKTEDGRYIHTMIFGHFRTGENYNDEEERDVSGRNGYGAKVSNVFSSSFQIEAVDPEKGIKFTQMWNNNMRDVEKPKLFKSKLAKGYTCIKWIPDFKVFNMKSYTDEIISLFYKYVIDTAMLTGISVYFNDVKVNVKNLEEYSRLYLENPETTELVYHTDKNTEVVLVENSKKEFKPISFVNGIYTMIGGKHVDSWSESIFRHMVDKLNKKDKPQLNIRDVKQFFYLFINCKVVNPEFESQNKHKLESPDVESSFPTKYYTKIMKWHVFEYIEDIIHRKELVTLKNNEAKKRGYTKVEKLDSANNEGGKNSTECILIICEGDSAATYATSGIKFGVYDKKGRDWFGILPIRGKLLNVRNSNVKQISASKVILDIIHSLGLRFDVDYTQDKEFKTLRYGMVMTLTDADVDGLHILGLIQNMIEVLFPSLLLREKPFLVHMSTPIATISSKNMIFFDEREYNSFMKSTDNKFKSKYYKGLGSSSRTEVKDTFGKKLIEFSYTEVRDSKSLIDTFKKDESDRRKEMMEEYNPESYKLFDNGPGISSLSISDFLNYYMIQFSIANCKRMIPGLMDGLKESQRKVLYACFKRNLKSPIKVSQLAGYISEHTAYHHGEVSLQGTIIGMASCYTGGNNLPLLARGGEFGSRKSLGKDAASPRYIFTYLDEITRIIFNKEDDDLLDRIIDDGMIVEPKFYVPVIPTVLANPCNAAIGSGWSSTIPGYNPLELVECVKAWLSNGNSCFNSDGENILPELLPWYLFYKGEIKNIDKHRYKTYGVFERIDDRNVEIKELPIGVSTDDFYDMLKNLLVEKEIEKITNLSSVTGINFKIKESENGVKRNMENLKLSSCIATSNLVLFDENGKIKKYNDVYEIIDNFCKVKYEYVEKRKNHMIKKYKNELKVFTNKKRFLEDIISKKLVIFEKEESVIVKELEKNGYDKINKGVAVEEVVDELEGQENEEAVNEETEKVNKVKNDKGYEYLLGMHVRSFSSNKLNEFIKEIDNLNAIIKKIENTTVKDIWISELDNFKKEYENMMKRLKTELEDSNDEGKEKVTKKRNVKK